ncbi:SMI1/KNR4 family protein [Xenorhabdus szentirmaii]|uniref:SMI1/KNR4 family protein n=1 Tax=Xenorhabdus szentirmaii TaxID=290112 RepID=UPI0019A8DF7A|nr:SMI1/KNR4 family protein [Xenorhabdus sp. 5]MBD2827019.1 SMI1/KNR4 family protein [Xenorhabdus sp. 5]
MPILHSVGLTDLDIENLENKYRISFPNDYKLFLRKYNGFYFVSPDYCEFDYDGVDEGIIAFDAFFGDGIESEHYNLQAQNDSFLDEINFIKNSFIIGADPGGNFYILVTEGEHSGVYYWDRTHLHAEDELQEYTIEEVEECGNLYKVSDSFGDFFKAIFKFSEGVSFSPSL